MNTEPEIPKDEKGVKNLIRGLCQMISITIQEKEKLKEEVNCLSIENDLLVKEKSDLEHQILEWRIEVENRSKYSRALKEQLEAMKYGLLYEGRAYLPEPSKN